jgi:hypothetical protein
MIRRFVAVVCATVALMACTAVPSHASAPAYNAILSGSALSSSTVVLAAVNPNFDLWPVYSYSEMDNAASHTLSAGFWPGFLIDAFFWLYKFQPVERSALGVAESLWPNAPHVEEASSSRYATGNVSDLCGFALGVNAALESACRTAWDPLVGGDAAHAGTARATSARTDARGVAQGTRVTLPGGIQIGALRSTSNTHAMGAEAAVSEAAQLATDVHVGSSLVIETIEALATAQASGRSGGATASSVLHLGRVTFNGQPAEIDDQGVHVITDEGAQSVNAVLAAQGFDVRLFQGRDEAATDGTTAKAASGGLVVRVVRDRIPEPLPTQNAAACAAIAASPLNQELYRVSRDVENPLYSMVPFAPLQKSYQIDEPIPPVVPCPYMDRAADVGIVLGTAAAGASAKLVPAPPPVTDTRIGATPDRVTFDTVTIPGTPAYVPPSDAAPAPVSGGPLVVQRHRALNVIPSGVAAGVKVLYGAMWMVLLLVLIGRFSFRTLMRS